MKIALVTETFIPATDGIVTRMKYAVEYMIRKGHEVIIYAPDLEGTPKEYKGAQVKTFHAQNFSVYKERPWAIPSLAIGKQLKEDQPDIVHAFNPFSLAASGAFFADKLNIPLVSSFHTNIPQYLELYGYPKWVIKTTWSYIRHWHNLSYLNMVPSQAMRNVLDTQNIRDAIVLPKGVDLTKRHPSFKNHHMRDQLMADKTRQKLLLFVGRLAPEKNIASLRTLLETRNDVNLAIIGDGPDRQRLEKQFKNLPVTFTGFLHGDALSQAFASADAFVFPSTSETLGQVILEAMASGLPVIAAESEPTKEQINHGQNGLIYQSTDPNTLSTCIDTLEDPTLKKTLIQNGLAYARQFSWDNTTQTMIRAYEQAIVLHTNTVMAKQNKMA